MTDGEGRDAVERVGRFVGVGIALLAQLGATHSAVLSLIPVRIPVVIEAPDDGTP